MPIKNKEAYNEYMRNYRTKNLEREKAKARERYYMKKEEMLKKGLELADKATQDPKTGKKDSVITTIEIIREWTPVVMELIKGFKDAMKDVQTNQGQLKETQNQKPSIQPPLGWVGLSPLKRMTRKYAANGDVSEWYKQGEAYEEAVKGKPMVVDNTPKIEATTSETERVVKPKYDDSKFPLVTNNTPPPQLNSMQDVAENTTPTEETAMQIKTRMARELVESLQKMSMDDFKKQIERPSKLVVLFQAALIMGKIPKEMKEMLVDTKPEEMKQVLAQHCPDKMLYIREQKKEDELTEVFIKIQEEIKNE